MHRDPILEARQDRNAALVEAMLMAAISDGKISQTELQHVLLRVLERPEFEGMPAADVNALVQSSADKLSQAANLDEILQSFRARLPDHRTRLLAFGLAASVAFADQRATREELGLLKTFQGALGISEDEVIKVIEVIEKGGSLTDALGEPIERLYAEVMVLITAADGQVKRGEARALVETLAADRTFDEISPALAQNYVSEAVEALEQQGLPQRIAVVTRGLSSRERRLRAFGFAARVARASPDGSIGAPEQKVLDLLQASFGLADDEVARLHASV